MTEWRNNLKPMASAPKDGSFIHVDTIYGGPESVRWSKEDDTFMNIVGVTYCEHEELLGWTSDDSLF